MKRLVNFSICTVVAAAAAIILSLNARAADPACDADNGGIKLPQGFCATVVAENVGNARHLLVAPNGDLFVSLEGRGGAGGSGGIVALRDTNGDGKMDTKEKFGVGSATGIGMRNGFLYFATTTSVIRYKLPPGELKPSGGPEIIVDGLPDRRQHAEKGLAFDGKGGLYVNVGAPSNACQSRDRQQRFPDRIRVRCSRNTAASGASMRTSPVSNRRTANATQPACGRWSASRGTTTRCGR